MKNDFLKNIIGKTIISIIGMKQDSEKIIFELDNG